MNAVYLHLKYQPWLTERALHDHSGAQVLPSFQQTCLFVHCEGEVNSGGSLLMEQVVPGSAQQSDGEISRLSI